MKTTLKIIIFFSLVTGSFIFYTTRKPNITAQNTFTVGMMSGWAPFMTVNATGNFVGFDVDVAQEVAQQLKQKLEIIDFGSLAPLLLALEQKKIAAAFSGLDITQTRLKQLRMIPYTGETVTNFCLLFWEKIPQNIACLEDFKKLSSALICVEPGSAQEKFLDQYPYIPQKSLSKLEDMVLDIKYKKSLAMLVEPQVARRLIKQEQNLQKLAIQLPPTFQTFGMGIALSKDNAALEQKIIKIIKQLRANGTLSKLEKKWGLT